MRKKITIIYFLIMGLSITGCVTVHTYQKERVDQNLSSGNRGTVSGTPAPAKEVEREKTREIINIEVELPTVSDFKKPKNAKRVIVVEAPAASHVRQPKKAKKGEDSQAKGNVGYIQGESIPKDTALDNQKQSQIPTKKEEAVTTATTKEEMPKFDTYTVKKNDSLWKIAALPQVYSNGNKWKKIYQANKEKIKNPNKLRSGMVLTIPRD